MRSHQRSKVSVHPLLNRPHLNHDTTTRTSRPQTRSRLPQPRTLAARIRAVPRILAHGLILHATQITLTGHLSSTTEQVQIVNHPTPLSVPVDFEEIHFVIRQGKIAYIPLSSLLDELMSDARRKIPRLFEVPEITGTVGPVGGFKLEYSIVRRTIGEAEIAGVPGAGAYAQLRRWILIPEGNVGEPVAQALEESSEFRRRIAGYRPDRTTVTIWCYPDGFADFRRLKDFLHERGYSVAGRPLPDGFPITGSPGGTKSSAQ